MTATQRFAGGVHAGAAFFLALLALACGGAASGAPARRDPVPSSEENLARARSAIERAFTQANADNVRAALSRRVKTYVSSDVFSVADGYYGADQMLMLFRRLFEGRETAHFAVLGPLPRQRKDGQAILPISWSYREGGSTLSEARISFTLAPEGPAWRIREIRDLK